MARIIRTGSVRTDGHADGPHGANTETDAPGLAPPLSAYHFCSPPFHVTPHGARASVRCAKTPSLLLLRCCGEVPPRHRRLRLAALPAPARTRGHTRRARDARAMAGAATLQEGGVPSCTTTR